MKTTARITWALVSLGLLLSHCVSNSTADDDPTAAAPPMTTPRPPAAGDAPQSTGAPPPPPDAASSSALGGAVAAPATTVPAAAKPDAASVAPDAAAPQPITPPPPPPTATTAKPPAAVVDDDDAGIATTAKPPTPVVTDAPPTDAKVSTVAVLPKDDSPTVAVAVAAEPQPTPGPPTVPAGSAAVPVPSTAAGAAPTKPSGVAIVPASPAVTTVQTVEVVTTADSPGSKAIAPNPTPEDPGLTPPPVPPAAGAKDDGVSGTPAPAVGADTTAKESADGHGTSGGNVIPTSLTALLTTSPVKTTAAGSTRTGSDPSGSGTTTLPIVAVTEKKTGTTVSPLLRYHATPEAPAVSTASRTEPPITPTTSPTTTTPTITTTAVAVVESLTKTISFTKGRENKEEKDLGYVCTKLMEAMHAANCTMTVRQHRGKTSIDSVQIEGTVNPSLATRYYEEITKANAKKSGDNSTLIAILASCGALLVMIVGLAIYAHHRKPYNENQQHLTEELATVENGYHDNPTLEVMEVQPEMQEKKTMMALNGDFNDSWIVPIDNLPDEEDTHL